MENEHDYKIANTSIGYIIKRDKPLEAYAEHRGVNPDNVRHYWHKTHNPD